MDLAVGAKTIWVMMKLFGRDGSPKLTASCSYPLTAAGVVSRVYTDVATFHLAAGEVRVTDLVHGVSVENMSRVINTRLVPTSGQP
jgi:3-oxoadipate CoA-transferase beta subunit